MDLSTRSFQKRSLFDYVRRAMPCLQPQPLSDDEVYAVMPNRDTSS